MNFDQARAEWNIILEDLDVCAARARRVSRDPLPINTEDVAVMQRRLDEVQRRLERMFRGLS